MRTKSEVGDRGSYHKLDAYWKATVDFLDSQLAPDDRLIAPSDIGDCFPANECHSRHDHLSGNYHWVVLHKGLLREAEERGLLVLCLALEPVFANEVFVVFSEQNRSPKLPPDQPHYQSFRDVIQSQFAPACFAAKSSTCHPSRGAASFDRPAIYMGDYRALTKTVHGQALYVDTRDLSLTPRLLLEGKWEDDTTGIYSSFLRRGATVIEIGANVGYYVLLAASRVGRLGRVIAFEPNRDLCDLLSQSLFINGFQETCEIVNKAVTDRVGTVMFQKETRHMGGSSVISPLPGEKHHQLEKFPFAKEEVPIESISLDAFLEEKGNPAVDLIKIDAEGSEPLIFKGMSKLLHSAKDLTVIFEFHAEAIRAMGADPLEMLRSLVHAGFSLRSITPSGLVPLQHPEEALSLPLGNILMQKLRSP